MIVEIDGGQHGHDAHSQRDARRDQHFASRGFKVLRFWNTDVDQNLGGVLETIAAALTPPGSLRSPPSPNGEG
jgi:very-short-patch-repair endonuclease